MTGTLQPLEQRQALVDPATGFPTMYFIQWAQQRQIDIGQGITAEQAQAIVAAYLASKPLLAGAGINLTPSGDINTGVTISAEIQELLNEISTTHGTVLFRGAADWQELAPGTAGYFLQTGGPGADPVWAAGGGGGGGGLIGTVIAPGTSPVLSLAAIPGTFEHLEIFVTGRSTSTAPGAVVGRVTFNGDTGANYGYSRVNRFGSTNTATANFLDIAQVSRSGGPVTRFDSTSFQVIGYKDATKSRQVLGSMITSDGGPILQTTAGTWYNSTNPITSVEITLALGNWVAGSQLWVYGK